MANFSLTAASREDLGKGASRRLRREGSIPAVLYGGSKDPASITLKQNEVARNLMEEAFYTSLIKLELEGNTETVVLRDLQRHPSKPFVIHVDLQRINDKEEIKVVVPLHFVNEEVAPGIKTEGGHVNRLLVNIEISCLPKDIPEFIEVDLSSMHKGDSFHLSDVTLPEGVTSTQLALGEEYNLAVVAVH